MRLFAMSGRLFAKIQPFRFRRLTDATVTVRAGEAEIALNDQLRNSPWIKSGIVNQGSSYIVKKKDVKILQREIHVT